MDWLDSHSPSTVTVMHNRLSPKAVEALQILKNGYSSGSMSAAIEALEWEDKPWTPFSLFLGDWFWNHGTQKSKKSFKRLLETIGSPQFHPEDIQTTHWEAIDHELSVMNDDYQGKHVRLGMDNPSNGWMSTPITISVPFHGCYKNPGPKLYTVPGFRHRSLVDIICDSLLSPLHHFNFNFEPFELHWNPPGPHKPLELRLYSELCNSPAFLDAQMKLQHSLLEPGGTLPRCIVGLMFWSDATVLTTFGEAKLWLFYVYFGNESKYLRCQPFAHLCTHVAYFMTVGALSQPVLHILSYQDILIQLPEFVHAQWQELLDDGFLQAYEHGIVLKCGDGIERRLYPRIFTYSADYPENDTQERHNKILSAREPIYEKNYAVDNSQVEELLKTESMVPTVVHVKMSTNLSHVADVPKNAFSTSLGHTGFNLFMMLVVDLLHKCELGVCKGIFIHLLRILDSLKKDELAELDHHVLSLFLTNYFPNLTTPMSSNEPIQSPRPYYIGADGCLTVGQGGSGAMAIGWAEGKCFLWPMVYGVAEGQGAGRPMGDDQEAMGGPRDGCRGIGGSPWRRGCRGGAGPWEMAKGRWGGLRNEGRGVRAGPVEEGLLGMGGPMKDGKGEMDGPRDKSCGTGGSPGGRGRRGGVTGHHHHHLQ
ncbi:hypothetical protein BDN67DRAFT_985377 [Paxillus ammoniavirescens]|nr:hypothetical protein BDN67DRAFT_985377 [Paxillus ammoniavirescens]